MLGAFYQDSGVLVGVVPNRFISVAQILGASEKAEQQDPATVVFVMFGTRPRELGRIRAHLVFGL